MNPLLVLLILFFNQAHSTEVPTVGIAEQAAQRLQSVAPAKESTEFPYDMQIYISEGMPEGVLRQIFKQSLDYPSGKIRFVVRGFEPQKLGEMIARLRSLFPDPKTDKIIIEVDPGAFRQYQVEAVPTYLIRQNQKWFEVRGAISIEGAIASVKKGGHIVQGELYAIKEPDILSVIEERAKNYDWSSALARVKKRMMDRLSPSFDLPTVTEDVTEYFAPTFTLPQNIVIPKYNNQPEKMIAQAGTTINVLNYAKLQVPMIVFDQEDERQLRLVKDWIKTYPNADLFVVGQIDAKKDTPRQVELSKEFGKPVYPWFGKMTDRFGVRAVPAIVDQQGDRLRIRYVAPKGF